MRNLFLSFITLICFSLNAFAEGETAAPAFTLNTSGFLDHGILPVVYTCDGKDISPQFDWVDAPAKTQSFVLMMQDNQAPGGTFYHWVLFNIPKNATSIDEGAPNLPAGTVVGKNSWGKAQYNGPCPPKDSSHAYVFTLYALDNKLSLSAGAEGAAVQEAIKNHVVGTTSLTAVYSRWIN